MAECISANSVRSIILWAREIALAGVMPVQRGSYEDKYRRCYIRGPEGMIVALAEEVG